MALRSRFIASVSGVALICAASAALAQNTPAAAPPAPDPNTASPPATARADTDAAVNAVQGVVVTGVRASVLSAQNIKRKSDQVVDSVVAEDIGKLPDDNVAEALQRVTGVQITRNADEGVSVLIRGLPNVVTLLNGRELFTTFGRYVALADVPAAFLQRVDVYKSNAADQLEGGIAGTIDARLHRPFDFRGSEVSATGRLIYSSLSDKLDPNLAVLVSNRWMTGAGEVGALVGLSYQERHYRNEVIDNFVAEPLIENGNYAGTQPVPTNVNFANNIGQQTIQGDRRRPAANFAVQWRPNDQFEFYTEGLYTEDRNTYSTEFFVGLPNNSPPPPFGGITSYQLYPGTNEAKSITSSNAFSIASTQAFEVDSLTYQIASGGSWVSGPLKVTGDLAYTHSVFYTKDTILDTSFFTPNVSADTNYRGSGTPYLSYTGMDLTNPANFALFQLFDDHGHDTGASTSGRIDGVYTLDNGLLKTLETGFRYAHRTAESSSTNPSPRGYPFGAISAASIPGLESVTPSGFFQGDAAVGVTRFATPNPTFLIENVNTLRGLLGYQGPRALDPTRFFRDTEDTYSGYAQARTNFLIGSVPTDGVLGVRLVETDQDLSGFQQITQQVPQPGGPSTTVTTTSALSTSKSNFDVLPSVNVKFNLRPDIIARFAANRTITRPDFPALNPAVSVQSPGPTLLGTGTGGNPSLNEVKSNNYDLALEYYFARTGNIYSTAFYRDLSGYIQTYAANESIGGSNYLVTTPHNTGSGRLTGVEIGYTQFYDFLPSLLRGIGLQANFTYIDGVTQGYDSSTGKVGTYQPLVNVSRYTVNAIGLYELGPYSARIAYNWRSKFVAVYSDSGSPTSLQPSTVIVAPTEQLDMSFSYRLSPKATITFDAVNALNSIYQDSFGGSALFPRDTRRFDQTFELGFRWSL